MANKPEQRIKALPKTGIIALIILNIVLMGIIYFYTDSPWGWTEGDLSDSLPPNEFDYLAIIQIILFAITVDQMVRRAALNFNDLSEERHIPRLILQVVSVVIYALIGLIGFILLYDKEFNNLIAATSGLGIGVLLVFKDSIAEVMAGLQLQTDKLVNSGDYLQITEDGKSHNYQVMDMAQRYITLRSVDDNYLRKISNPKFLALNYINVTKQASKRGARRSFSIELFTGDRADKVVEIFTFALEKVTSNHKHYMGYHLCNVVAVKEGAVEFKLEYESRSDLLVNYTNGEILLTALRFLKAACIKIESRNTDHLHEEVDNAVRLLNLYDQSILLPLRKAEIIEIAKNIKTIYARPGTHLIKKDAVEDSMYLISEGVLDVSVLNKEGNMGVVATLWPGDCVGEMSLLTGAPRSADVHVRKKAILLEIKKKDIEPILKLNEEIIERMSNLLAERMASNEKFLNDDEKNKRIDENKSNLARSILAFFFGATKKDLSQ